MPTAKLAKDTVVVVKEEPWRIPPGGGFPELLLDPGQRWRRGNGGVHHASAVVSDDHKHVANAEVPEHFGGEIERPHFAGVAL